MMLADAPKDVRSGWLDAETHLPSTAKRAMVEFIAAELPNWRDHPERPKEKAETRLTEHLCDYLNSATYSSVDWSHIQFRTETGDERRSNRTIDLSIKPRAAAIIAEGRRHNIFDSLLPIECKRLPTPRGSGRDEREYVFNQHASTGGIQRFKVGDHGSNHTFAVMIAYVQEETCDYWVTRVFDWITGLVASNQPGWTVKDSLCVKMSDSIRRMVVLDSSHERDGNPKSIELCHLWIQMNRDPKEERTARGKVA